MKKFLRIFLIVLLSYTLLGSIINVVSPYKATVIKVEGTVLKKDNSNNIWIIARNGDILDDGDSLKTKEDGYAELRFEDGSIVKIKSNTELSIYKNYLSLAIGYVRLYITKLFPNFEIRTPSAIAGVRGTEFSVEVLQDKTTLVTVYDGEVDITAQGKTIRVRKGESGIVRHGLPPSLHREEREEQGSNRKSQQGSPNPHQNRR